MPLLAPVMTATLPPRSLAIRPAIAVLPESIVRGRCYARSRRIAITLGLSALVSAYPTARIATGLDPHRLRLGAAGFLVGLAALVAYRALRRPPASAGREPLAWGWTAVVGLIGGVATGLFGVG